VIYFLITIKFISYKQLNYKMNVNMVEKKC
jgi:hypothetical protein